MLYLLPKLLNKLTIDEINKCTDDFNNFNNDYTELKNQLVRLHNIYSIQKLDDEEYDYVKLFNNNLEELINNENFHDVLAVADRPDLNYNIKYSYLAAFYIYWESFINDEFVIEIKKGELKIKKDFLLFCKLDGYNFRCYGYDKITDNNNNSRIEKLQGVDAGGVFRDFISKIGEELKVSNIFKCLDEDKQEGYYYIDPNFEFNDYFISSINELYEKMPMDESKRKEQRTKDYFNSNPFKEEFFKFFGSLLSFLLINGYTLPFKLSSAILSTLIYPTINISNNTYHHQFYYLYYDNNDIYKSYKVFIKDPSLLEGASLNDNDLFTNLHINDESQVESELTQENFKIYLEKLSKYRFPPETHNYYKSISEGFNYKIRECLNIAKTPLFVLEKSLSNTKMTLDEVKLLKEAFNNNMTSIIDSKKREDLKEHIIRITGFMNTILSEPFTIKNHENDQRIKLTDEAYLDFITELLRFWSGWIHFKETDKSNYKINVISTLNLETLPSSHTCFYIIDMPAYTMLHNFIDKLYMAVKYVEQGIGRAGGGKIFKQRKLIRGGMFFNKLLIKLKNIEYRNSELKKIVTEISNKIKLSCSLQIKSK